MQVLLTDIISKRYETTTNCVPAHAAIQRGVYSLLHLMWMLAPIDTKYLTTSERAIDRG